MSQNFATKNALTTTDMNPITTTKRWDDDTYEEAAATLVHEPTDVMIDLMHMVAELKTW